MNKLAFAAIPVFALAVSAISYSPAASAAKPSGFTTSGHQILRNGQPFTCYGFTLSTFQDGIESNASNEYATVTAQLRAIQGAWHGNTVRLQVEQDEYLSGGDGETAAVFQNKVNAAISYAEGIGLVVVINDQTEPEDGINSGNELLPTSATLTFWKDMEQYKTNPDIILDPFNEPRYLTGSAANYWNAWHNGLGSYIGANALIKDLRADGYTSQLWMEAPGNYAFEELGDTYPAYLLTDSLHNVVYSYHHTAVDQNTVPTAAEWNTQFGNLVTEHNLPVVDCEWANRSVPYGSESSMYQPSGDTGQCWGNAPVSVPAYLAYLAARGIGMTVWTMGNDPTDTSMDYVNADGDISTYVTANNYSHWAGCVTPKGGRTSGSGQDVMNWFAAQA